MMDIIIKYTDQIDLFVKTLMPILIAIIGFNLNRRLKDIDVYREKEIEELERRHKPHIEFIIDANVFGPQHGYYLVEFLISVNNRSLIRHKFYYLNLHLRGISKNLIPELWPEHGARLCFPDEIKNLSQYDRLDDNQSLIPKGWTYIFVEPGIKQEISFITRVEESYYFVLAKAKFYYDKDYITTPHTTERMFELKTSVHNIAVIPLYQ